LGQVLNCMAGSGPTPPPPPPNFCLGFVKQFSSSFLYDLEYGFFVLVKY
jgi:hypothetical protein